MARKVRKTEHNGPKKGAGAYWGRKWQAKLDSARKRRANDKKEIERQSYDESLESIMLQEALDDYSHLYDYDDDYDDDYDYVLMHEDEFWSDE